MWGAPQRRTPQAPIAASCHLPVAQVSTIQYAAQLIWSLSIPNCAPANE